MLPFLWKQRQDTVWLSVVYHPATCHQLLVMRIPLPFFASRTVWLGCIGNESRLLVFCFFSNVLIQKHFELFSYSIFPGSEGF